MKRGLPALGVVLLCAACGPTQPAPDAGGGGWQSGGGAGGGGGGGAGGAGGGVAVASGPSHSTTLTPGGPNQLLAVNPLIDALISTPSDPVAAALLTTRFASGSKPSSLAVSPDGTLVYVALRGRGELWRVSNPSPGGGLMEHVAVGSEPVAVALTPRGQLSVVALAGEKAAVVVDNSNGTLHRIALPGVTRAVAVTNTGAASDQDEKAYVTLFFAGAGVEGSDTGRDGLVAKLNLRDFSLETLIHLKPIADTGIGPNLADGGMGSHVSCFPNQLSSILIAGTRAYVASICASPQPPLQAFTTAFSALSVIDLSSDTELRDSQGSTTLVQLEKFDPTVPGSTMFSNPVDLTYDQGTLYVLSQGSNRVAAVYAMPGQPLQLNSVFSVNLTDPMCGYQGCGPLFDDPDAGDGNPDAGTTPGSCGNCDGCCQGNICIPATQQQGPVACGRGGVVCEVCDPMSVCTAGFCTPFGSVPAGTPIGVTVSRGAVVVNDMTGLQLTAGATPLAGVFNARSYAAPGHAGAPGHRVLQGVRFFSTALDRWSAEESLSCATCHPDGRADSVTWVFGAGPRQTVPLDGTFAKGDLTDHRAQNWTAVADEIYDVEGLVRSTMKGLGAMTQGFPGMETPISLTAGISINGGPVTRNDGLNGSSRTVSEQLSVVKDWVQLEQYVQQVHTPAAPFSLDAAAVARGRALFQTAGCDHCHAGPKWTLSHVPYLPSAEKNGSTVGDNGMPSAPTGLRTVTRMRTLPGLNFDTFDVASEHVTNPDGGVDLVVGPERITCVLRSVGTFDLGDPLENKSDGTRAQGALGFNVPSLLGAGTTAPYFHNGAAATLEDVFQPKFQAHFTAGSSAFAPTAQDVADLVAFLESIDESTPAFQISAADDLCIGY